MKNISRLFRNVYHTRTFLLAITCIIFFSMFIVSCCNCKDPADEKLTSLIKLGHPQMDSTKAISKPLKSKAQQMIETDNGFKHYGVDISHYQGNVLTDISPRDSLKFVICKVTQGNRYVDPMFHSNWRSILEMGLIRGGYHFYVCSDDPLKQAQHYASMISDLSEHDIAPVVDIEQGSMTSATDKNQMQKDILIFLKELESLTKRKPILYTDYAFSQEYLNSAELSIYDLWLAEYSKSPQPKIPNLWKEKGFKIWQKSSSYTIDSRKDDYDVFSGPLKNLVK